MNTFNWNRGQVTPLILQIISGSSPISGQNPKYSIHNRTQSSDNFNKFWNVADGKWQVGFVENEMTPNSIIAGQYEAFFDQASASGSEQEELIIIYRNPAPYIIYQPEMHIFGRNKYTDVYVEFLKKLRINNQSLIRKKTICSNGLF